MQVWWNASEESEDGCNRWQPESARARTPNYPVPSHAMPSHSPRSKVQQLDKAVGVAGGEGLYGVVTTELYYYCILFCTLWFPLAVCRTSPP